MKAYWVVRGNILNQDEYAKYVELAGPIVRKYNGKFLARGGQQIEVEGEGFERTVLIEFNSFDEAVFCYNSDEYQEALIHVRHSANRLVTIVEGVS
ncbi:DUF1330 domain-containing protein [Gammaproteobacteria bacterium]|nr:DUF1330 domain-containing protein [Gammaproteobacteria bacterium]MDC1150707.1 DUF1330 domain-containing protein [Gammaproteobacteria bacterium]